MAAQPKGENEGKDWAEFAVKNEEAIGKYIDRIASHFFHATTEKGKHREILTRAQGRAALAIVTGVLLLFAVALFLTYTLVANGRLSGETFVFFIGALLGSLFTLLAERVVPLLYPAEEDAES